MDLRLKKSGKSYLLGIGINEYQDFEKLNNAVKDVNDFKQVLVDKYELDEAVMLFNEQATRRNIIAALDELRRDIKVEDKLIIYYSGHGHLGDNRRGYWIPYDAHKAHTSEYIRNTTLKEYLEDIKARHILLISDSCFSGTFFVQGASKVASVVSADLEKRTSRWALCSGRHDEIVADGIPGRNSPFASSILDTLRSNTQAFLNIALLTVKVIEQTRANYQQLPEGSPVYGVGHNGGQYIFKVRKSEANLWATALQAHTIPAYNSYLDEFPKGQYAPIALQQIKLLEDERAWARAKNIHRVSGYQEYLINFPQGTYREEAKKARNLLQKGAGKVSNTTLPVEQNIYPNNTRTQVTIKRRHSPRNKSTPRTSLAFRRTFFGVIGMFLAVAILWFWWATLSVAYDQPISEENQKISLEVAISDEENKDLVSDKSGHTYATGILKDGRRWMLENLNLRTSGSFCYKNQSTYCQKYGRLYNWEAAQIACKELGPDWHLPSDEEWSALASEYGGVSEDAWNEEQTAYQALINGGSSGFNALLGGLWNPPNHFYDENLDGRYWSSSDKNTDKAWDYFFNSTDGKFYRTYSGKSLGFSCRCIQK